LAALAGAYLLYLLAVSAAIAWRDGAASLPRLPIVIGAYHLGYGLGTWQGVADLLRGRAPAPAQLELTR
jgi:hypothetical protein